jgi:hypothetical protein
MIETGEWYKTRLKSKPFSDFITADFLYMFRASSAHHQEYKLLTRQPPVQVVILYS